MWAVLSICIINIGQAAMKIKLLGRVAHKIALIL